MKASKILLFLSTVLMSLAVAGYVIPDDGIALGGTQVRFASLHSLTQDGVEEECGVDSVALRAEQAYSDSMSYYRHMTTSGNLRLWLPEPHYLDELWRAAGSARAEGRTLRVLHYGDSQIEMDRMSGRLRRGMQQTFGGGGPGMLPFHPITLSPAVRQSNEGKLIHLASFGDSTVVRSRGDYGLMMQSFRMADGKASVRLRASQTRGIDERVKRFSHITLLYNNRGREMNASVKLGRKGNTLKQTTAAGGIGSLDWTLDSAVNDIRLTVSGKADLYGVLVDDGPGVAVDNIPMRGCSGQQFTLVPDERLGAAYSQMDIGLIIMQFGGNSVPYIKSTKQIANYCRSLGQQIDHLRRCCPQARILFVGPSDMSTRIGGRLQTYPMLPQLVDSLAATATAHGVAYWSIYHAMGGKGSMAAWNKEGLAGADYIHFTQKGADLMGDRLWETLYASYRLYTLEQNKPKSRQPSTKPRRR